MVWREGSLSAESRRALIKLRSLGVTADEPVLGYAPRVRVRDVAFEPLNQAMGRHAYVRFSYLKPGEEQPRIRVVAPLALVQHQGRWHLSATEEGTGARRTFLLRRIVSKVTTTGKTFPAPEPGQSDLALRELEEVWNAHTAIVDAVQQSDAESRLGKRRGTTVVSSVDNSRRLSIHYSDVNIVADELASFGPEVLVLEPADLRAAVRDRLLRTAADHA
jgi:proteasome accessory factor B